MMMDSAAIEP